tara:strand:+ start:828 stop:1034 length:207 start_codon:yes stop_codon:yes gene_type:complete
MTVWLATISNPKIFDKLKNDFLLTTSLLNPHLKNWETNINLQKKIIVVNIDQLLRLNIPIKSVIMEKV